MKPIEKAVMVFGVCWWLNIHQLGVWNFGAVLTIDRLTWCVIVDLNAGPWTLRAGVNA